MRIGYLRILDNVPALLGGLAGLLFLARLARYALSSFYGETALDLFLSVVTAIVTAASEPALLLGIAATAHYLKRPGQR